MNIDSIREFVVFAKYLNFSRAAKEIHISQPAMSNHIAAMENELGVELVDRHEDIRITTAGRLFLSHAQQVLDSYDEAVASCQSIKNGLSGKVIVREPYSPGKAGAIIAKIVSDFCKEYPLIDVVMKSDCQEFVLDEISKGRIDCGLFFNFRPELVASDGSHVDSVPICNDSFCVWVHRKHPLATKASLLVKDLAGYPLLIARGARFQDLEFSMKRFAADHGIPFTPDYRDADSIRNLFLFESDEQAVFLVGTQASLVLEIAVREDMVLRSFDENASVIGSLVYSADNDDPAFKLFIDYVERNFAIEAEG
ncbi:MAG: LysR family transcriptional regulator [Coriobacteriia bacterium]|nr:LysR family transcriptional regulator [Coriobacteriia bacterium]